MDLPAIPFKHLMSVKGKYDVKMRLEPAKVSPAAYHAMLGLESFANRSSKREVSLLDLVKMRASHESRTRDRYDRPKRGRRC
jgi:hypothetical protein